MNSLDLYQKAECFLEQLFEEIKVSGLDLSTQMLDHICYRTTSHQNYQQTKELFEDVGILLIESEIGGRPIATYKLHKPICFNGRAIRVVEVPAPKEGAPYKEGFEHAEFVIDEYFDSFISKYPHLEFKKPSAKKLNSELNLKRNQVNLKFHYLPLESVICLEKNQAVLAAVESLGVFKEFACFNPQISGSVPLGISGEGGDVDILFDVKDFNQFKDSVLDLRSRVKNFEIKTIPLQSEPCVFLSFNFNGNDFEWVGQNKCSLKQRAHQHLLIEARLLNIAGPQSIKDIAQIKQEGLKTEPAFAKYFGIEGDPYLRLLEISQESEQFLFNKYYTEV